MPDKLLLLPSARIIVVRATPRQKYLLYAAVAFGVLMVLVGAADLSSRLFARFAGPTAAFDAFAPAAALQVRTTAAGAVVGNRPQMVEVRVASLLAGAAVLSVQNTHGATVIHDAPLGSIAGVAVGDYITITNAAGKTEVYKVQSVGTNTNEIVSAAKADSLVLTGSGTAVVATPAYR